MRNHRHELQVKLHTKHITQFHNHASKMALFTQKEQLQLEEASSLNSAVSAATMPRWQRKALAAKRAGESNTTPQKMSKSSAGVKTPGVRLALAESDHLARQPADFELVTHASH